ncbi:hypothetical protein [Nonomuraea africana]|uniref:FtsH ternary system domain-containing protein n=1 Tax=Nonomuraea africana TaxID=46171 RepID=A0ABR9KFD4_9ACTN|nr:hypothetical protein [Nonomuraea africana]MBE1560731.1 hypothetical protein [Nonomuraea africana]
MRFKVVFRVSKETGQVEEFVIDDLGAERQGEEHDAVHDGVARAVGAVVERRAAPEEVDPRTLPEPEAPELTVDEREAVREREQRSQ